MDQDMVRDVQCCDDDHGDGDEGDNDDDGDGEYDDDDDAVILTTMTTAMLITTVRTMKMMTYATLKDKRLPGKKMKIFFWRIAANRIDSLPFAANLLPAGLLRLSWLTVKVRSAYYRVTGGLQASLDSYAAEISDWMVFHGIKLWVHTGQQNSA